MELENAIKHAEKMEESELNNAQVYDKLKNNNMYLPNKDTCELVAKRCRERATEYRQLAEWLKILKSAKFEYNEAWLTITHPTPDVTYADKQRAQVILDKFRNSLGAISALQTQDVNDKNTEDTISRRNMIDELKRYFHDEYYQRTSIQDCINCFIEDILTKLPSAQPEYEPVKAEDFAKTMSENTFYGFMVWHSEALELMKRQGFVICKKTL